MAGDNIQHQGTVGDVFGYGANLVERAGEGDQPVAADSPVGGFQADHAAEPGGLPDVRL